MATGRRERLNEIGRSSGSTHAGLWFERYVDDLNTESSKRDLMVATATIGVPPIYGYHYDLWCKSLPSTCCFATAEVIGRMLVGSGEKGAAEAGITLHQTYGVPYIPGSALKGLTATYANIHVDGFAAPTSRHSTPTPYEVMFGTEMGAGYVTFFDALYIPNTGPNRRPLEPDVITGHHSGYYVGNTPTAPADWDSPIPVPILTAVGCYLIALDGPDAWVKVALEILGLALRDSGIGAKTAAGYGRMRLQTIAGSPSSGPTIPATFVQQVKQSVHGSLPNLIVQWRLLAPEVQQEAAKIMISRARELNIKKLEDKPWYKELEVKLPQA
jgi:CRISPR-associated protein Cmr6